MALFLGVSRLLTTSPGDMQKRPITTEALRAPGFRGAQRLRCASLAQAGLVDEARAFLATVRRQQPQLSIGWIRANLPYQTPQLMEHYLEGMRKAGLDD